MNQFIVLFEWQACTEALIHLTLCLVFYGLLRKFIGLL